MKVLPSYVFGRGLPRGGPDRVRFCVLYGDAMAAGKTDVEARREAAGMLLLLHSYKAAGIVDKIGPNCAGIPVEFIGDGP